MKEAHLPLNYLKIKAYLLAWMLAFPFLLFCQSDAFTIEILDEQNVALIGVLVYNQDNSFTASSDIDGKVMVTGNDSDVFTFRYLTYKERSIAYSDLKISPKVRLEPEQQLLDEVIVIGRLDQTKEELPYIIETISAADIALTNPQTSADALAQHGNVFVQKSQMGGGSPVIRGFEANKVLLVVDGVRMNNAIYRNGHLQNSITVDQAMLEQTELIFGPNSLLYGSDALGGVVHFRTKKPVLSGNNSVQFGGNYYARFASVNKEKSIHLDFNIGTKKWGFLTSLTFADFSDLQSGSNRPEGFEEFGKRNFYVNTNQEDQIISNENPNLQVGTAYKQYDVLQKILFQANKNLQFIGNIQYSTSSDIPRYDELSVFNDGVPDFSEWYYGPQERLMISLKKNWFSSNIFFDKMTSQLSYQKIEESRNSRVYGDLLLNSQIENLDLFAVNVDFQKKFNRQSLVYGLEYTFNDLTSTAFNTDINSSNESNALTRYPSGGSDMSTFSVFVNYSSRVLDSLFILNAGVRYNSFSLNAVYDRSDPFEWPENFYTRIGNNNNAFTAAIGLTMDRNNFLWRVQFASAFRNPNIDDFAKIRIKRDDASVPNANLISEKAFNMESTLAYYFDKRRRSNISFTAFRSALTDAIIRIDYQLPNGDREIVIDGRSYNVEANVNAAEGFIYGFSGNFNYRKNAFEFNSSLNYTKGRTKESNGDLSPLGHIPPVYGQISLAYEKKGLKLQLVDRFNGSKALSEYGGSTDNPDFATSEGALSWNTLNFYSNYKISNKFQLSFAVENIFDLHYRLFASGLSAGGRNFSVGLRGSF